MSGRRELDVTEAAKLAERGDALLLDVRELVEWQSGRAPDAAHIPMSELRDRLRELPRDRPILAVCRSGMRSDAVADALRRAGYDALNVAGGMKRWVDAGLPLEPPDGRIA